MLPLSLLLLLLFMLLKRFVLLLLLLQLLMLWYFSLVVQLLMLFLLFRLLFLFFYRQAFVAIAPTDAAFKVTYLLPPLLAAVALVEVVMLIFLKKTYRRLYDEWQCRVEPVAVEIKAENVVQVHG